MHAASAEPTSGARMNTHKHESGSVFPSRLVRTAGAMLRAGFTEVPVRPIPKMCTSVSVRPMTRPPNEPWFAFFDVTPRKLDNNIRGIKDVAAGNDLSWLRSITA